MGNSAKMKNNMSFKEFIIEEITSADIATVDTRLDNPKFNKHKIKKNKKHNTLKCVYCKNLL